MIADPMVELVVAEVKKIQRKRRGAEMVKTIPPRFSLPLMSKVVDKGTIYERTVYLDPNSASGQDEVIGQVMATFHQNGRSRRGKSPERRAKDAIAKNRRFARRRAHEAWMKEVASNPTKPLEHPFYVKAA